MADARTITAALGGRWHGSYGTARCPVHDDHHPSLSIRDGDHDVLLTCHAGCSRRDIISALAGLDIWAQSHDRPAPRRSPAGSANDNPNGPAALRLWREAEPAAGTRAESYLRARGIDLDAAGWPIPSIRYIDAARYTPSAVDLPCMVAAVQGSDRRVRAVHRTFLDPRGHDKAHVARPRLWLGGWGDGAIRLAPAGPTLALAEGIEDGLSYMAESGLPAWAAGSAGRLASVALPDTVREVVIAADNDGGPGVQAAKEAAQAHARTGRRVHIHYPPDQAADWNEAVGGREVAA